MLPSSPFAETVELYVLTSGRIGSEKTADHYRRLARSLEDYLERTATLADLNDETIGGWITYRRGCRSPNTVRGEAAKMLAVWRWTAKRGGAVQPELVVPRRAYAQPRAFSESEMDRLWTGAAKFQGVIAGVPGNLYFTALIWLCWDTGERVGAVHALRWQDIDIRGQSVYFRAETRKGGLADARKKFEKQTMKALYRLQRASPRVPFSTVKLQAMYYHWGKLRQEVGLPSDATPHAIRRSHATYLTLAGGDACASLGHSSPEITQRHYLDPTITQRKSAASMLPNPIKGGWLKWLRRG